MKTNYRICIFLMLSLTLLGCKKSNTCLKKYPAQNKYKTQLAISINSSSNIKDKCAYLVSTLISLPSGFYCDSALFYLKNDKFYMKLLNPLSEDFVLFDMSLKQFSSKNIEIKHANIVDRLECVYENKLITDQNLEVRIFRIKKYQCLEGLCLDAIFFITKEYGIIGSYFTDPNYSEKIIVSPAGNIFSDYIDYSNYTLKKAQ
jgi:hypothetical protein